MRKSKEPGRIVDLHQSGSLWSTVSRCVKVPRSSVQTIIHQYKHHGYVQPSQSSGSFWDPEMNLLWCEMFTSTPEQKLLPKLASSTEKPVLDQHRLKNHSQEDLTPKEISLSKRTKILICGDMSWSDETETELFGHNDHRYIWRRKKMEANRSEITTQRHGQEMKYIWV